MTDENYRSATKSHDPGWNDPPKLSYNSPGGTLGHPTKLNLNKRVAFPMSKQTQPSHPLLPDGTLPKVVPTAPIGVLSSTPPGVSVAGRSASPMVVGTPPKSNEFRRTSVTSNQSELLAYPEDKDMMNFVGTTLGDFTLKLESSKQAEIQKRLDVIQRSWADGKIREALGKKLYRLAKELTEGRATEANEIHRSLIVEHGSACVQWAPALRQLVLLIPKQPEEIPQDAASASTDSAILNPL
ncbi:steroid receptor RNA activator 1-like [Toxorhynchites rutilus septentrionalis]|uniref:steroid receptor RNA activator 1-like n=1 Tax=Toxorhynchites rutilus septentrionalis TaxID=329112 RepID=UPI00247B1BCC|nr:steroid receptor RNA activator 1-like [Toxorhynchites rutilus septentrionalis]